MINIIAAMAKNRVIGANGKIPWDIPEDKKYFSRLTQGSVVIMGRRTFEEIGFPLPNRYNIIVSKTLKTDKKDLACADSLEQALSMAKKCTDQQKRNVEIFLCGGERIYNEGLKKARRIYLTELENEYNGDAFFPEFDSHEFKLVTKERSPKEKLYYCVYERL